MATKLKQKTTKKTAPAKKPRIKTTGGDELPEAIQNETGVLMVPIEAINDSTQYQMRADGISDEYVDYLCDVYEKQGWVFPPIEAVSRVDPAVGRFEPDLEIGSDYYTNRAIVINGFHRVAMARKLELTEIPVKCDFLGEDSRIWDVAQWRACFADLDTNDPQPLGRSNKDKKKAAHLAISLNLRRPKKERLSDRELGAKLKLSHTYISNLRKTIEHPATAEQKVKQLKLTATLYRRGVDTESPEFQNIFAVQSILNAIIKVENEHAAITGQTIDIVKSICDCARLLTEKEPAKEFVRDLFAARETMTEAEKDDIWIYSSTIESMVQRLTGRRDFKLGADNVKSPYV